MKYSIVIPTLTKDEDHARVLQECLMSVREYSGDQKDYEIIIINDASPYNIETLSWNADTYVRRLENKGIPVSWNEGIKLSHGDYVAIINDDIVVEEGWLDKLRQALEFDDEYFVAAPGVAGQENGEGIEEDYQWFPGYCFMMEANTISKIGLFDEQFSPFNFEDTDYWTRILQYRGKLVRNYKTTIKHREGHVLHTLEYDKVSAENKAKFITKHGFDPIPVFYEGKEHNFTA